MEPCHGLALALEIIADGAVLVVADGHIVDGDLHGSSHSLDWVFSGTKFVLLPRGWDASPVLGTMMDGFKIGEAGVSNEGCREGRCHR